MAAIQMLQGAESRSPARQIRIHFRFRIGAIAKSSAPQWALYADTADREGGCLCFHPRFEDQRVSVKVMARARRGGILWQGCC